MGGIGLFPRRVSFLKVMVLYGKPKYTTEIYAFVNKSKIEKDIFTLRVKIWGCLL